VIPPLDDDQASALVAVAELYLSETRWAARGPVALFSEEKRQEILRRRAVCELVTTGGAN
jgi:hypothetical protein